MKTSSQNTLSKRSTHSTRVRIFGYGFIGFVALRFLLAYSPHARSWGLNHLAFHEKYIAILFTIVSITAIHPKISVTIFRMFELFVRKDNLRSTKFITIGIFLALIFFFPVQGFFLGDGYVYTSELFRYLQGASVDSWLLFSSSGSALLTGYTYMGIAKVYLFALKFFSTSGSILMTTPWVIGGMMCSVVFIFLLLHLNSLISRFYVSGSETIIAVLSLMLLTAPSVFLFGYVEYYVFSYTAMLCFIVLSYDSIMHDRSIYFAITAFLFAVGFHITGLLLFPSLLYMIVVKRSRPFVSIVRLRRSILLFSAGACLFLAACYYLVFGAGELPNRFLINLMPYSTDAGTQSYALASWFNAIDIVNLLFLLVPTGLFVFLFFLGADHGKIQENGAVTIKHEHAKTFSALLVVAFVALLAFGNSAFGKARDWDIYSGLSLSVGALALLMFMQLKIHIRKQVATLLFVVAFTTFIPWLLIHVHKHASVSYFRSVMQLDDRHVLSDYALNGYEHLRKSYQMDENYSEMLWTIRKKIDLVGYPSDFRQAFAYFNQKDFLQKEELATYIRSRLMELLTRLSQSGDHSIYAGTRQEFLDLAGEFLYTISFTMNRSYARETTRKFQTIVGDSPQLQIADALEISYTDARSIRIYEQIDSANTSSALLAYAVGFSFVMRNENEKALEPLTRSLRVDPHLTNAKFFLGVAQMYTGRKNEAVANFNAFLKEERNQSNPLRGDAEKFLVTLQKSAGLQK